ncbi:DNA endonuclease III [Vulcanisaeta souniana JCM 11219]|uniref:DNA endonuclease III n=2 Tax=Vulcanisaeta souniana TaxID=164452 RepID=A0A830E788_9CREN|nr:DNA endonuclease III [Vulcanisaeta souniana JCM 11219]GGI76712.1 DNA endonuclease III [Vulcanisaeta souniana JCM 11219]
MNGVINKLLEVFKGMRSELESVGWFPGDAESTKWWGGAESPDEVVITAILVQQTRWDAVHAALNRLRQMGLNRLESVANTDPGYLAEVIKGVNYRFTKAMRLVRLARNITMIGGLEALRRRPDVREFLLGQEGIGKETADSIMLFALNMLSIPISQYMKRVINRILGTELGDGYETWKGFLEELLPRDLYVYKLVHASIVTIGKKYCLLDNPLCNECPLREVCLYAKNRELPSIQQRHN